MTTTIRLVETNRSTADVSREYGLNETTVGGWVKKYRAAHASDEPPLELFERARLRELERRNRELEMETAFLKKASAYAGDRCQVAGASSLVSSLR